MAAEFARNSFVTWLKWLRYEGLPPNKPYRFIGIPKSASPDPRRPVAKLHSVLYRGEDDGSSTMFS